MKATDKGVTPEEGYCSFRVHIEDINDNTPVFSSGSYSEKLSSSSAIKGTVSL